MHSRRRNNSRQACLTEIADGWLEYIVRDVLAVTHEAVFAAVMRKVDAMASERQSPAISAEVLVDRVTPRFSRGR
jgi:hypothetical protein